jgi:hypothetical protein
MYPIPEYRPSTPQSAAQPEMVDTVKTYKAHSNTAGRQRTNEVPGPSFSSVADPKGKRKRPGSGREVWEEDAPE